MIVVHLQDLNHEFVSGKALAAGRAAPPAASTLPLTHMNPNS